MSSVAVSRLPGSGLNWSPITETESWQKRLSPSSGSEMPDGNNATTKSLSSKTKSAQGKRPKNRDRHQTPTDERPADPLPILENSVNNNRSEGINLGISNNSSASSQLDAGLAAHDSSLSPYSSPSSPVPTRHINPTSSASLSAITPNPAFTQPVSLTPACFSPVAMGGLGAVPRLPGTLGAMGLLNGASNLPEGMRHLSNVVPKSCSDLMRSMAAKYNNNGTSLSYYNSQILNGFSRPPLPPGGFPGVSLLQGVTSKDSSSTSMSPQACRDSNSKANDVALKKTAGSPDSLSGLPPHLLPAGVFQVTPANTLIELSSTQAFINMVRNASNMHQNHLQKTQADIHNHNQFHKHLLYQQQQQLLQQSQNHQQQQEHQQQHDQKEYNLESQGRSESHPEVETSLRVGVKRPADPASPLDLSSVPSKYLRTGDVNVDINVEDDDASTVGVPPPGKTGSPVQFKAGGIDPACWSVSDVYHFIKSIDTCAEYAENFREQRIDGACLSLLSETHLTESLKMKLGPALKLRSFFSDKSSEHKHSLLIPSQNRSCSQCSINSGNNCSNCCAGNHVPKKHSMSECTSSGDAVSVHGRFSVSGPVQSIKLLSPSAQENASPIGIEDRQSTSVD